MNRSSLAQLIARKTKLSKRQAENLVIAFGAVVTEALEREEKIVYSNFGSFYTIKYPSKTINHPKNGKRLIMLPTNVAKFMPAESLKKLVNSGKQTENPKVANEPAKESTESVTNEVAIKVTDTKTSQAKAKASSDQLASQQPAPSKETLLKQAHANDDIEAYHQHVMSSYLDDEPTRFVPSDQLAQSSSQNTSLGKAQEADDIEAYHQHKIDNNPDDIFEEVLSDGTREFSTVKGAIKVHRDQGQDKKAEPAAKPIEDDESRSPLDIFKDKLTTGLFRISKKKEEDQPIYQPETPEINMPKINLASAGIFDKNIAVAPHENSELKINEIKEELKQSSPVDNNSQGETPPETPVENQASNEPRSPLFSGAEGSFNFDKTRIEYRDLSKLIVPKEILGRIPENIARSYKSVAFEENDGVMNVAMVDPEDIENREMLKRVLGEKVKIFLTTESDINSVLSQYQGFEKEVSSAIASAEQEDEKEEETTKSKVSMETISDDAPAAKIVSSLLKRAIRDKASDIHIEPTEKEVEVRFRLDGVLRSKVSLPKDIQAAVISRIKILSNLKIDEQRIPQDGRFNIHIDNRRVDFRVSSMPVAFGEKIVMRILDKDSGILTIEELGIRGSGLKILDKNLGKSHGMVLVTGPTGSGKSTTLYAMIQKVFSEGVNIITLEDPIEYQMKGINQSQVNSDIGYTFAAGLRSILRQDPDIIMLGEIRDRETAEMAVHAALTGHVVLSTLHTNDAAGAAPRMIDMGVEPFLLTSSINVVVGQRLVRKICQDCKEEVTLPEEEIAAIKKEIDIMPEAEKTATLGKELKFYHGKGCKSCDNSGYKSRIGIYEVLEITPEMQSLILKRVSSAELNALSISQGMVTMVQDGILKAIDGITSMEEVWRATRN